MPAPARDAAGRTTPGRHRSQAPAGARAARRPRRPRAAAGAAPPTASPPPSSPREAPPGRAHRPHRTRRRRSRGLSLRAQPHRLDLPPPRPLRPEANPTLPARGPERFAWPFYGYTKNHTRYFPAPAALPPPFRRVWARGGSALREFPPVLSENRIFQLTDDGTLSAIDKYDGKTLWSRRLGALSAASPAVVGDTVYATILARAGAPTEGRVRRPRRDQRRRSAGRATCPAAASPRRCSTAGKLFFGSEDGTVYALDARTGGTVWTYHAEGAVKASPTLAGRGALLRRLLRPRPGDQRADRPAVVARQLRRRAVRQRHLLLHRRRHLRPRLPRQHRRAHLRLRRLQRQARLGLPDGRLRLRLARRHRRPRASARRSTSAPTTATSTP